MPIAFTFLFAFAFSSAAGEDDPRLPVGFIDSDNGLLSPNISTLLSASEVFRLDNDSSDREAAEQRVADAELSALIIIPPGFSEHAIVGDPIPMKLIIDSGSSAGLAIDGEVSALTSRLASAVESANFSLVAYEEQLGVEPDNPEAYFFQGLDSALEAWQNPPVTISADDSTVIASDDENSSAAPDENPYAHTSPGMMAQFAIAGLMGASAVIVLERKSGALNRLVTTPISKRQILAGHFLAMLILIFVQLLILILFGQIFLDLDYLSQPLATLLIALSTAFFTASLGLLIGAVAKTEDQVVILGLIPMFVLAGFGGAWVPLEIMPGGFQQFAKITPLGWVINGYQDILVRGHGLETVWVVGVALMAYSIILLALALWQFRFE